MDLVDERELSIFESSNGGCADEGSSTRLRRGIGDSPS